MIIKSILENDLYAFTQQRVLLEKYPNADVEYVFSNRRLEGKFNKPILDMISNEIELMRDLQLRPDEYQYMQYSVPFLGEPYLDHLRNYRFNPSEVQLRLSDDNELLLNIRGLWRRAILWETPILAIISQCYFKYYNDGAFDYNDQMSRVDHKMEIMKNCLLAEGGMRRRYNYELQDFVVSRLKAHENFVGTSNVHLAYKHNVKPKGTMSHQLIMGLSALEGLRYANRHMLKVWSDVYKGELGIALPDTFGLDAFLGDFNAYYAKLFDGVRHDSGDPFIFGDKVIRHYQEMGISPQTKTLVFSDGLNENNAAEIESYMRGKIKNSYLMGTRLTNDVQGARALNMVIKLSKVNDIPVVKLSDTPGKALGDPDAIRIANWTFFRTPLDS